MIRSFAGKETENIWFGNGSRRIPVDIQNAGLRKLTYLDRAKSINDLHVPSGNRLEQLKGKKAGTWSIRINDQRRICFKWDNGYAEEVEIIDYH